MIEIQGIKLYDNDELLKMLNSTPNTLTKLRRDGKLGFCRIGKKLYTSEEALRDYLNGRVAETLINRVKQSEEIGKQVIK